MRRNTDELFRIAIDGRSVITFVRPNEQVKILIQTFFKIDLVIFRLK